MVYVPNITRIKKVKKAFLRNFSTVSFKIFSQSPFHNILRSFLKQCGACILNYTPVCIEDFVIYLQGPEIHLRLARRRSCSSRKTGWVLPWVTERLHDAIWKNVSALRWSPASSYCFPMLNKKRPYFVLYMP